MDNANSTMPVALTIAGSDCSAGAGLQADLKTFLQHGVHGLSAVSCVVAETPLEVGQVATMSVPLLQEQVHLLLDTYPVDVIKVGLLPTRASVIAVAEIISQHDIPAVIDPVMVASAGAALADSEAAQALCQRLLAEGSVITPNLPEAEAILSREVAKEDEMVAAAKEMSARFGASCLLKGGHLAGEGERVDVLCHHGEVYFYRHPRVGGGEGIHGTGCTLSSAVVAGLALGKSVPEAVESGIGYVQGLIRGAKVWGEVRCLGWG